MAGGLFTGPAGVVFSRTAEQSYFIQSNHIQYECFVMRADASETNNSTDYYFSICESRITRLLSNKV